MNIGKLLAQAMLSVVMVFCCRPWTDEAFAAPGPVAFKAEADGGAKRLTLENDYLRLVIRPDAGGRIESLVHKPDGKDLVARPAAGVPWGLLADGLWQQDFWHSDSARAEYQVAPVQQSPQRVKLRLSRGGTLWHGVTISKEISLAAGRAAVDVHYDISGDGSDPKARGDVWIAGGLVPGGQVFFPSAQGVLVFPRGIEPENWAHEATRGWMAALFPGGAGLAVTLDYSRLRALRSQHENATTLECILRKADLQPGCRFSFDATVAPLAGLKSVAGVCPACAVAVESPEPVAGTLPVQVIVAPLEDNALTLSFELVRLPDGRPLQLGGRQLSLKAGQRSVVEVPVTLSTEGSYVLSATGSVGRRPVIRFEKLLVAGRPSGVYAMQTERPRVAEVPDSPTWSRYHPIDLNFNATAIATPHRVWARPYAGGRPRVLALVHGHQARQAVELAQRFDMDLTVPFLTDSSYYALGDRYRSLSVREIQDAAESLVLGRKFDVILASPNIFQAKLLSDPRILVVPAKLARLRFPPGAGARGRPDSGAARRGGRGPRGCPPARA